MFEESVDFGAVINSRNNAFIIPLGSKSASERFLVCFNILLVVKLIYAEACLGFKFGKWDHLAQDTGQDGGLLVVSG